MGDGWHGWHGWQGLCGWRCCMGWCPCGKAAVWRLGWFVLGLRLVLAGLVCWLIVVLIVHELLDAVVGVTKWVSVRCLGRFGVG